MPSFISIDTETSGKDPMTAKLRLVGVAYSPTDNLYLLYPRDKVKIQEILASPLPKVAHNMKYDYKVLVRHGFKINGVLEDTLIISQMNGELKSKDHKLKTLVKDLFNEDNKTFDDLMVKYNPNVKKALMDVNKIPTEILGRYCANDCSITHRLYTKLLDITDKDCLKVYHEIEKPLLRVVLDMEMKGLSVDVKAAQDGYTYHMDRANFCKEYLYDMCGCYFKVNPSLELEALLFDKLKMPVLRLCDNGRPKLDDSVMKRLAKMGYEEAEMILHYRRSMKLANTYFKKYINMATKGKIYANFQQTGTETGRFSSSKPNLQNIDPEALHVFKAEPGNILLSFDYKQMELILMACLSEDKVLSAAALAGRDLHSETAEQLGVDRIAAKVFNFGIPYRMGSWGISQNLKAKGKWTPLTECQAILDRHKQKFYGVEAYAQRMIKFVKDNGYVATISGRKRFLDPSTAKPAQCVNTPIQGGCADIIKIAMLGIAKYRYIPVAQVHDELIFEVPISEKEAVIKVVVKEMENAMKLPIPMRVSVVEGYTLAELKQNK